MKLKDYILIAVLSVASFVLSQIGAAITGFFGVHAMYLHTSIGSVLAAPVYMVMCHKIAKRGTAFIFYLINGIIYILTGFSPMVVIFLVAGIVAELIIGSNEGYKDNRKLSLSYIFSQLIYALHGAFFIIFLGARGLAKQFPTIFTEEMATELSTFILNPKNLAIILTIQIVFSIIAAKLGVYIYEKFFSEKTSKEKGLLG